MLILLKGQKCSGPGLQRVLFAHGLKFPYKAGKILQDVPLLPSLALSLELQPSFVLKQTKLFAFQCLILSLFLAFAIGDTFDLNLFAFFFKKI